MTKLRCGEETEKTEMKKPSEREIRAALAKIEADERYHYAPALVQINAPLALVQVDLTARAEVLAWVLGESVPKRRKHGK